MQVSGRPIPAGFVIRRSRARARSLLAPRHPGALGDDIHAFLQQNPDGPSFVLAFYSQPHFPYTSSAQYARRYHVPGSSPSLAYGRDVTGEAPITTDADRRQVDALYRAALTESDAAIGKLLAGLRTSGWLDDTIVVLTADHAEGLYEHPDCVGHGDNLRGMMTIRVPLAFRLPKRYGAAKPGVYPHYVESDRISIDPKYEGVIRAAKHRAAIRAPYMLIYEPSAARAAAPTATAGAPGVTTPTGGNQEFLDGMKRWGYVRDLGDKGKP